MANFKNSVLGSLPPVTKNIILINVILFLIESLFPNLLSKLGYNGDVNQLLGLHFWAAPSFNPVQFVTYMFLHGSISHIFFNMFALFMFGSALEYFWGSKRFLVYYLVTGIGAAIIQQLFWQIELNSFLSSINSALAANVNQTAEIIQYKNEQLNLLVTIGASGSIFGLLLAFGWYFPEQELFLMFIPIPIKARVFVALYAIAELFFGVARFSGDNIAHFAHLGGMLFGIILILIWKRQRK